MPLNDRFHFEIFLTFSRNIFRTLKPKLKSDVDVEEEEPALEVAWPHLQVFLDSLASHNTKLCFFILYANWNFPKLFHIPVLLSKHRFYIAIILNEELISQSITVL